MLQNGCHQEAQCLCPIGEEPGVVYYQPCGLFDQKVLACRQDATAQIAVAGGRGQQDHRIDSGITQNSIQIVGRSDAVTCFECGSSRGTARHGIGKPYPTLQVCKAGHMWRESHSQA